MSKRRKRNRDDMSSKRRFAKKGSRREPKDATKGSYNSIEYDSLEELAMLQWLFELKNVGYIKSIKRADSYLLCDSLSVDYAEQLKTKSNPKTQTLLHGHSYTPEFEVIWNWQKARDKFVWDIHSKTKFDKYFVGKVISDGLSPTDLFCSIIEIKPSFDMNNMERLFKLNQKWMWQKHGVFVNLIKIKELFPTSFTPKAYLTTPSGRVRVLKWKQKSLYQFLNDK